MLTGTGRIGTKGENPDTVLLKSQYEIIKESRMMSGPMPIH